MVRCKHHWAKATHTKIDIRISLSLHQFFKKIQCGALRNEMNMIPHTIEKWKNFNVEFCMRIQFYTYTHIRCIVTNFTAKLCNCDSFEQTDVNSGIFAPGTAAHWMKWWCLQRCTYIFSLSIFEAIGLRKLSDCDRQWFVRWLFVQIYLHTSRFDAIQLMPT